MAIGLPIALLWYFAAADRAGVPVAQIFGTASAGVRDLLGAVFSGAAISGHPVAQRALRTAFVSIIATILVTFALFVFRRERFGRLPADEMDRAAVGRDRVVRHPPGRGGGDDSMDDQDLEYCPGSMNRDFRSDNTLGCSPEIAEALERAGHGSLTAYGNDEITARVRDRCRTIFNRDVDVFPVLTGTAGNALAVAAMTPPWGAVFCHEDAHIQRDELGAVEFYSGGAKLMPIAGAGGKLHPEDLAREIDVVANSRRTAVPAVVSLTQATEAGTVYSRDEMRELCEVARSKNVRVHIDGARFANALVAGGGGAEDADILTFGATKNGALGAEVIVVFARELAADLALRVHRAGHRVSKMRILSAQLEAYLSDDLWLRNARHANAMAGRLRDGLARVAEIVRPVEANVIFVRLPEALATRLQEQGFLFFDWPIFGEDVYRLVCGFSTTGDDVDGFVKALGS